MTEEFDINTIGRGIAAAGVVALITTGAAACGSDEPSTPQGKVTKALTNLGNQKAVTLGLSFDGTAQQIYDAVKGSGDSDDFTLDDAKIMAALHVSMGYSSDKSLGQLTAGDNAKTSNSRVALQVTSGDGDGAKSLVGLRSVDQKLYVQADVKGIVALDPSSSDQSEVNDMLASVDQLPASFASIKTLVHGGWVSLDVKAFTEFAKSLGGDSSDGSDGGDSLGLPSDLPTALPSDLAGKTFTQLLAPLQQSLQKDAKLTDLGSKDGADHIKASIPARALATDLKSALDSLGSVSKSLPSDVTKGLDDVPNKTVSLDLAIKGGDLTGITVDLAQFDDTAKGSLPLTLSIEGSAAQIDAPKGAKELNPQDLMGLAMQDSSSEDD